MKLFWAFDALEEHESIHKASLAVLRWISKPSDVTSAVYVSTPFEFSYVPLFDAPTLPRLQPYPEPNAAAELKALGSKDIPVTVITNRSGSQTGAVRAFVEHVEGKRGDLIVLATHARKGMPRFLLGSFAETMIHFAKTDILVFQPKFKTPQKLPSRILYANDFSRSGNVGLERVVDYAKHWDAVLEVMHIPKFSYVIQLKGEDPSVEDYRRNVRAKARRIERRVKAAGVSCKVSIVTDWAPMPDMILKEARRRKADIIAMTAQSGRFAALLGGSTTRGLIRQATLPTLVLKT